VRRRPGTSSHRPGAVEGGAASEPGAPAPSEEDGGGDVAQPSLGTGVTASEIRIGFQVTRDVQAAFAAVGASGRPPEERLIVGALVDWVNANGGLAGRRLVPVIHETNPLSGTFASQAQAACATFTEDNEVFAAGSSPVGGNDALVACLASKGTPLVEQNHWWFDTPARQRYMGMLYQPAKLRPERGLAAYVDGLAAAGYFTDGIVGIARFDDAVFTKMTEEVVKPGLARHGVRVAAEAALSTPRGVSDFGRMSGEINNAILRFRSAGVNRVLLLENSAIMSFFFTQQAEAQGYRPRYGLSTYNTPTTLANQASAEQLRDALAVGWAPGNDVYDAQHPGGNPTWELCMRIFREAGVAGEYSAQGYYLMSHCDTVMFLRAALSRVRTFTAGGLRAAVDALGEEYRSPFSLSTRLGPGRHDGAEATRLLRYDAGCTCFAYAP
jgi:ABC-type branched-subunit amino acid transport system substrate-binding protein